ncbi:uroporphyrinogen-III synthase [Rhizobiales bacterium GAS188]|nr:uroporphyrinogen-III synthase [Rhizobiales bacterium GAS188]
MKILVLRPQPAAARTARALARSGHEAIIAPLIVIAPAPGSRLLPLPADSTYAAVIAASANALAMLDAESSARLAGLPALLVGARTARAAAAIGLRPLAPAFRTARELAAALPDLPLRGPLLYLTGHDRRPEIETALRQGRYAFTLAEVYSADIAPRLPPIAETALRQAGLDAVLHYSARSATAYIGLAREAGVLDQALTPLQLCLSAEVAQVLLAAGASRVEIPASPDEAHLLALLGSPSGP